MENFSYRPISPSVQDTSTAATTPRKDGEEGSPASGLGCHGVSPARRQGAPHGYGLAEECAVARHVIDNHISVETVFRTDDPDPTKFYNRSMNEDAWRSFMDTSTGMSAFLVGEAHIIQNDPNAPSLYELLKLSLIHI